MSDDYKERFGASSLDGIVFHEDGKPDNAASESNGEASAAEVPAPAPFRRHSESTTSWGYRFGRFDDE